MDVDTIFRNINRMLEYRLNSHRIKFDIVFNKFDGDSGESTDKLDYVVNSDEIGGHIATYRRKNATEIYKTVYLDIDIGHVKTLINNKDAIILHAQTNRKIKKIIKSPHLCQFFVSSMFLSDYKSNVYFTYMCKSSENNLDYSNLQYISSRDFSVMYCGLSDGDIVLAISIVDPTLILPQLRIVKKDVDETDEDD